MRFLSFLALLLAFLAAGCGLSRNPASSLSSSAASFQPRFVAIPSNPELFTLKSPEVAVTSEGGSGDERENLNTVQEGARVEAVTVPDSPEPSHSSPEILAQSRDEGSDGKENPAAEQEARDEEAARIADPLEPFNRAMYHFNDKLYFWALKPVSQGYNKIVPEAARVSVKNFFSNLGFPVRFISCLLQVDFSGAAAEFGRFAVNTIWGIGGLLDPSSSQQLNLPKREADFGQTLGLYGVGQGLYIVWPVLGPSSARDSVGIVGDFFLYPVSYIRPWYDWLAVRAYQEVNDTSLRIGDYESLQEMAIDPYVALRDAYSQYRQKKVEARMGQPETPKPGGVR
jgi:phospholipid-binding lipoprotein MlaA